MSVIARSHKGYDVVIVLRQLLSDGVTVIVCFHLLLLGLTHRGVGAPFARKNFVGAKENVIGSDFAAVYLTRERGSAQLDPAHLLKAIGIRPARQLLKLSA